jgi:hypothetical protein
VHRSRLVRLIQIVITATVSILLVATPTAPAYADPTIAELEAQIKKIWEEAEILIEDYNLIHEKYRQNKAKQAELIKKIAPLQRELDFASLRVGVIAAQVYKGGQADALNALLSTGSPKLLAERLAFLDQLAREQSRQVREYALLKTEYEAQKAPIDALVVTLADQDADLAARKREIEAKLAQLQALRRKAYGTTGQTGSFRPWPCPTFYEPTNRYKVAAFACKQAGDPYVWAAAGPNAYDCSGLVVAAWKQVGVFLPHQSRAQRASVPYITRSQLQLGDLVFYYNPIHHVAIYVGDNKIMQAPQAGDYVRMSDMDAAGPIHSYGRVG